MNKTFAILGLGTFGQQLCEALAEQNANILAVDIDEKAVNKVASFIPQAVCCDCTREENLEKLGITEFDHVIIAIGNNIQATILMTVILKEMGVKNLTVRVDDTYFAPIIKRLGATTVINPQKLAVQSLSTSLVGESFVDFYEIAENYGVASLKILKVQSAVSLQDMDLRGKYSINVLIIKRGGKIIVPTNKDIFVLGDEVIIFGKKSDISRLDTALCD